MVITVGYYLTEEQIEKIKKVTEEIGLEDVKWGFEDHNILAKDPFKEGNVMIGQVRKDLSGGKLEIYYRDDWPKEIKAKVDKFLSTLGLEDKN